MLKGLFKKNVQLKSPMVGEIIQLENVPDQVFSGKMIGEGFAVNPKEGRVYSPVDGKVLQVFPTKHAVGIVTTSGLEILIHVGIDTVELKGEGFKSHITAGDTVKAGDLILEVDLDYIVEQGKSTITPIIFTDKTQYNSFAVEYGSNNRDDVVAKVKL